VTVLRRPLAVVLALGSALLLAGGCNSLIGANKPELVASFDAGAGGGSASGPSCLLNSECPDTQICVFRVCSQPCAADKDCALAQRCLQTAVGNACVSTSSAACGPAAECPAGSGCKAGVCRSVCQRGDECLSDQVCVAGGCLGTDSGHDLASAGGAAGGSPGGGAGGASGAGGEAGAAAGEGGVSPSAGSGGAAPECAPGYAECAGLSPLTCAGGRIVSAGPDCLYACKAGKCSGECPTGAKQCSELTFSQCDKNNTWQQTTCTSVCDAMNGCVGMCTIGALQCNGATQLDVCSAGMYGKQMTCPVACEVVAGKAKCIQCGDADGFCPTGCKSPTDVDCPKEPGERCAGSSECRLGFCVNGVCCGSAACAGGSCFSCAVAGHEGTCTEVNGLSTDTDPANCGGCGSACSTAHLTAQCAAGACSGACSPGFADCNTDKRADGCEVDTTTDPNHCGGCSLACSSANISTRACSAGVCNGACAVGFADCDGNKRTNGCEINTTSDPNNCGVCSSPCKYRECIGGACAAPTYAGVVGPGPLTDAFAVGTLVFIKITIASAAKLVALGMSSKTADVKAYLGLYSDVGGAPQTLLAQTAELTTTATGSEGILATLKPVAATTYWIALTSNAPTSNSLKVASESTATSTAWYATGQAYGPLPASPPGLTSTSASPIAIPDFYAVTVP